MDSYKTLLNKFNKGPLFQSFKERYTLFPSQGSISFFISPLLKGVAKVSIFFSCASTIKNIFTIFF
jgi:hypothetical protein